MSIVSTATKKRMYDLAEEILSEERQNREAEAKGYTRNSDSLCRLYDDADHEFRASRIKSLLDELNNVHQLADSYRHRIAELEKYTKNRDEENQGLMLTVGRLRTEREQTRTITVELPQPFTKSMYGTPLYERKDIVAMLTAAGIKLDVGEL